MGCNDIEIRKSEFVAKNSIPLTLISIFEWLNFRFVWNIYNLSGVLQLWEYIWTYYTLTFNHFLLTDATDTVKLAANNIELNLISFHTPFYVSRTFPLNSPNTSEPMNYDHIKRKHEKKKSKAWLQEPMKSSSYSSKTEQAHQLKKNIYFMQLQNFRHISANI